MVDRSFSSSSAIFHLRARTAPTYCTFQSSWFARVNAFRNFSRKKSRKVAAATSGPISE